MKMKKNENIIFIDFFMVSISLVVVFVLNITINILAIYL